MDGYYREFLRLIALCLRCRVYSSMDPTQPVEPDEQIEIIRSLKVRDSLTEPSPKDLQRYHKYLQVNTIKYSCSATWNLNANFNCNVAEFAGWPGASMAFGPDWRHFAKSSEKIPQKSQVWMPYLTDTFLCFRSVSQLVPFQVQNFAKVAFSTCEIPVFHWHKKSCHGLSSAQPRRTFHPQNFVSNSAVFWTHSHPSSNPLAQRIPSSQGKYPALFILWTPSSCGNSAHLGRRVSSISWWISKYCISLVEFAIWDAFSCKNLSSYGNIGIVNLKELQESTFPLSPLDFVGRIRALALEGRAIMTQLWLPQVANLYADLKSTWVHMVPRKSSGSIEELRKFFACACSLMSIQLRTNAEITLGQVLQFITSYKVSSFTALIWKYVRIFKQFPFFQDGNDYGEKDEYKESLYIRVPLLTVTLEDKDRPPYITFNPSVTTSWKRGQDCKGVMVRFLSEIITACNRIPRVERMLFPGTGTIFSKTRA